MKTNKKREALAKAGDGGAADKALHRNWAYYRGG